MIDIIVQRGAGDYAGDDLTEPLLATTAAALARGRTEIDEAEPGADIHIHLAYRPELQLGQTVQIYDRWSGPSYRAKITQVQHAMTADAEGNISIHTELTARRPHAPD